MQVSSYVGPARYTAYQKNKKSGSGYQEYDPARTARTWDSPDMGESSPGHGTGTKVSAFANYMDQMGLSRKSGDQAEEQIDFSGFAPNAPEEVKRAFAEAAGETGYSESGKKNHISQITVTRVKNMYNGVPNPDDIFGNTVGDALRAARQMLYELENPLVPISQRGENAAQYIEQEKDFYRKFIEKLERLSDSEGTYGEQEEDYREILEEKINELLARIQSGDTEATYQIGAQSFTEKEWDALLEKFDSLQETIRELIREEKEKREAKQAQAGQMQKEQMQAKQVSAAGDPAGLLTTESTSCTYPTAAPGDDDIRYITWYTQEGIFCRKAGQTQGYEWSVAFEDEGQYDKVTELIGRFPSGWNMRFAAHENFWTDFLSGEIDVDGFMEFMEGTDKGVPDYTVTVDGSMYIDRDKMRWAQYLNPLDSKIYTAEELYRQQAETIAENTSKKIKISGPSSK